MLGSGLFSRTVNTFLSRTVNAAMCVQDCRVVTTKYSSCNI